MSNEVHWIKARIAEAREHHASVTEAVSTRLDKLLNGQISERPLRPSELADIANDLIADMRPAASSKDETKQ
jgi:hypothetical protein